MKILIIHDDCKSPGGSDNYRRQLSRMLKGRGVEIALFTFAVEDSEEKNPYYCYRYPGGVKYLRHIEYFYFNPSLINALRQWINLIKPDLIHIHHNYVFPTSVLLACRGKAPIIQTVHDFRMLCVIGPRKQPCPHCLGTICSNHEYPLLTKSIHYVLYELFPKMFLKRLLRNAIHYLIAPSRALEDSLKSLGFRTLFLPHFVDLADYSVTCLRKNCNTVLFVGYLHFSKGVDILLRAFSHVIKTIPSATLEIVGDGPYEDVLNKLCISLNLQSRVKFHGAVSHQAVIEFYRQANVIIVPSIVIENSPLVIYEAMASCRPVVASRVGGIPELILEGENGLLFAAGDENELSRKIVELLVDKEKANRMGIIGRKMAESLFSPEKHIEKYFELVHSLV